jgi:hypothetical protein
MYYDNNIKIKNVAVFLTAKFAKVRRKGLPPQAEQKRK